MACSLPFGIFARFDANAIANSLSLQAWKLLPPDSEPIHSRKYETYADAKQRVRKAKKKKLPCKPGSEELARVDTSWQPLAVIESSINQDGVSIDVKLGCGWVRRFRRWMIQCSACKRWGLYVLIANGRATCKRRACLGHRRTMPGALKRVQQAIEAELANKLD